MLFVNINHFLHFVIATHEDSRPIVNVLGNDGDHAFHVAVDGLAASCGNTSAWKMQGEDPDISKPVDKTGHAYRSQRSSPLVHTRKEF